MTAALTGRRLKLTFQNSTVLGTTTQYGRRDRYLGAHFSNSTANSDFYEQYLRIGGSWEKVARINGFAD